MNIGKSINVALAQRDMKRKDFSKNSKISESYISQVVGGNIIPKITTVERFAKAVGMEVSEFIALGE